MFTLKDEKKCLDSIINEITNLKLGNFVDGSRYVQKVVAELEEKTAELQILFEYYLDLQE